MVRPYRALLIGLLLLSGCASTPHEWDEARALEDVSITVVRRHPGIVCLGACGDTDTDLTVWPNGEVVIVSYVSGPPEVRRLKVSPAKAKRFRDALAPFRPEGPRGPDPVCDHEIGEELVRKVTEVAITWTDWRSSRQLVACYTPEYAALTEAMWKARAALELPPRR